MFPHPYVPTALCSHSPNPNIPKPTPHRRVDLSGMLLGYPCASTSTTPILRGGIRLDCLTYLKPTPHRRETCLGCNWAIPVPAQALKLTLHRGLGLN